ncbi:MAG: ATP-binding protein [Caulobacterales bacterium]
MEDLLADFRTETRVEFDRAQDALTRLEHGAPLDESISDMRRGVSELKASCAALGFGRIVAISDKTIALIDRLRVLDSVAPQDIRALRRAIDRIARIMAAIAATGVEIDGGDADVLQALGDDSEAEFRQARLASAVAAQSDETDPWSLILQAAYAVATQMSKSISVEIDSTARELPADLVQALSPALQRIIRHVSIYSLEPDLLRRPRGKLVGGTIRISALHVGKEAILAINDDGAGLDLERLRKRAVALGIVTQGRAADMPENQAAALVFAPRVSSLGEFDNESGLDRARTLIQSLGGDIEAKSNSGRGATFFVRAPVSQSNRPNAKGAAL